MATSTTQTIEPGIVPENSGLETWKNTSAGPCYIMRLGDYGRTRSEGIDGGRLFSITPGERRMNQNEVATPAQDNFTNGVFLPIDLIPGEPDTAMLMQNPNIVTAIDMRGILKLKGDAFLDRIADISNVSVIDELLTMAQEPQFKVVVAEYQALQAHRKTVTAAKVPVTEQKPEAAGGPAERQPKPVGIA